MRRARDRSCGRSNIALAGALGLLAVQATVEAGDVAYGEYLANECVTCHQRSGNFSGIPSITGWPQETFLQALNAYRWRERSNPIMQTIADQLSDEDMAALAVYFESLGPPKITTDQPVSSAE
jgi:cytochrome c